VYSIAGVLTGINRREEEREQRNLKEGYIYLCISLCPHLDIGVKVTEVLLTEACKYNYNNYYTLLYKYNSSP